MLFRSIQSLMAHNFTITIKKCFNVPKSDLFSWSDPYVKCKWREFNEKKSCKTNYVNNQVEPTWNYTFNVNNVSESGIKLVLFDHDKFSRDDKLGKIYLRREELHSKRGSEIILPFCLKEEYLNKKASKMNDTTLVIYIQ